MNGLGIGTPGTGISVTTSGVASGALYTTNYNLKVAGAGPQTAAVINAYVSTNPTFAPGEHFRLISVWSGS
jgi:hypothetical protein